MDHISGRFLGPPRGIYDHGPKKRVAFRAAKWGLAFDQQNWISKKSLTKIGPIFGTFFGPNIWPVSLPSICPQSASKISRDIASAAANV